MGAAIDPAGYESRKKIRGKKRNVPVGTQGLLMQVIVHAAEVQARDIGVLLIASLFGLYPFLPKRRIVEPTTGWLSRCRRLAKDWECLDRGGGLPEPVLCLPPDPKAMQTLQMIPDALWEDAEKGFSTDD